MAELARVDGVCQRCLNLDSCLLKELKVDADFVYLMVVALVGNTVLGSVAMLCAMLARIRSKEEKWEVAWILAGCSIMALGLLLLFNSKMGFFDILFPSFTFPHM
jgi:hypothetical protein